MSDVELSGNERRAISSLQRLGKRWPKTLMLASMGGSLVVLRTNDPRFDSENCMTRNDAVVADVHGIPNTGGDW